MAAVPDYTDFVWIARCKALYSLGQYEKAIENYDKVLQKDPEFHAALEGKTEVLQALAKMKE